MVNVKIDFEILVGDKLLCYSDTYVTHMLIVGDYYKIIRVNYTKMTITLKNSQGRLNDIDIEHLYIWFDLTNLKRNKLIAEILK